MTLQSFFDDVYQPERLFGKSANTVRLYGLSIRSFGRTLCRTPQLSDLTDKNLRVHMLRVVANGRAKTTANKDRNQLVAMWRLAFEFGLVDKSPRVPSYPEPVRVPEAWMGDEMGQLFHAIALLAGDYHGVPRSLWWRTLVRLALDSGERIGALMDAKWEHLSGDNLVIKAESRKGGRSDRAYRLSPEVVQLLTDLRSYRVKGEKIFVFPFCESSIWTHYGRILRAAKLPCGRKDKFHKLRKTTGSVSYAAGLDPQDVLDHQYRRTTKAYLDPRFTRTEQPCDIVAEYLNRPLPR
jgi:integrase